VEIAAPLLFGATHETVASPLPATYVVVALLVASGAAYGVALSLLDAAPGPAALIARSSTV
jgi:hypothetical protein